MRNIPESQLCNLLCLKKKKKKKRERKEKENMEQRFKQIFLKTCPQ